MKQKQSLLLLMALAACLAANAKSYLIESPDGKISLEVKIDERIYWAVKIDGKQLLNLSPISLKLERETLGVSPELLKSSVKEINETTQAVVPYKFKNVVDQCNELLLKFKGNYAVRFRAYNNEAAYRIEVSKKGEIIVKDEECGFNFAGSCTVLFPEEKSFFSGYERLYTDTLLAAIGEKQFCSLPALVTTADGIKVGITETGQSRYPAMFLKGTGKNALKAIYPSYPKTEWVRSDFYYSKQVLLEKIIENEPHIAKISGPKALPWRFLMLAHEDIELIENNIPYIVAEENVLEDVSWIKPGKAAWEWWSAGNVYGVDFKSGISTEPINIICILGFIVVAYKLPETKEKSLEEIEDTLTR